MRHDIIFGTTYIIFNYGKRGRKERKEK